MLISSHTIHAFMTSVVAVADAANEAKHCGGTTIMPFTSNHPNPKVSTVSAPVCTCAMGTKCLLSTVVPMRYAVQAGSAPPGSMLPTLSIAVVVVGAEDCPLPIVKPRAAATVVTTVTAIPTPKMFAFTVLEPFHSNGPPVPASVDQMTGAVTMAYAANTLPRRAAS